MVELKLTTEGIEEVRSSNHEMFLNSEKYSNIVYVIESEMKKLKDNLVKCHKLTEEDIKKINMWEILEDMGTLLCIDVEKGCSENILKLLRMLRLTTGIAMEMETNSKLKRITKRLEGDSDCLDSLTEVFFMNLYKKELFDNYFSDDLLYDIKTLDILYVTAITGITVQVKGNIY